jgi:hypothetical protein
MPSIQRIPASLTYKDILYEQMGVRRSEAELRSKFGARMTRIAHIYEPIDSAGDRLPELGRRRASSSRARGILSLETNGHMILRSRSALVATKLSTT